jgi:hypothetical protein
MSNTMRVSDKNYTRLLKVKTQLNLPSMDATVLYLISVAEYYGRGEVKDGKTESGRITRSALSQLG